MNKTPERPKPAREAPYSAGTPSTGYQVPPRELYQDPAFKAARAGVGEGFKQGFGQAASSLVAGASVHRNIFSEFGKTGFKEPPPPSVHNIRKYFTGKSGILRKQNPPPSEPPKEHQGGSRRRSRRFKKNSPKNSSKNTLKNIKALIKHTKKFK